MKYINKIKTIVFFGLFSLFGYSQISPTPVEITSPSPSVANLMSFAEIPVNTNTGVPDISIPLASLPTHSKEINVNVALSYHPSGVAIASRASDVGVGWNLIGDAVISRSILGVPDEYLIPLFEEFTDYGTTGIQYDDVYSYNFMGYSGKFRILYNGSTNTFSLEKLEVDNLRIEFNMISGTQKIDSFVIYDEKGFKYTFDIKDKDKRTLFNLIRSPSLLNPNGTNGTILPQEHLESDYYYYNAHHLSKITDTNGKEVVNYVYEEFIDPGVSAPHPATNLITNKVSEIHAIDNGTILFDFDKVLPYTNKDNDPIQLQSIEVKDNHNNSIKKFNFQYGGISVTLGGFESKDRRGLSRLIENNTTSSESDEYNFSYRADITNTNPFYCFTGGMPYYGIDTFGYLTYPLMEQYDRDIDYALDQVRSSKDACRYGVLESISYPTGGKVNYEFESNTYTLKDGLSLFDDENETYKALNDDNILYTELLNTTYNTTTNNIIMLSVTGNTPVKLYINSVSDSYYPSFSDPNFDPPFYAICKLVGNEQNITMQTNPLSCLGMAVVVQPGSYSLQFSSYENVNLNGTIKVVKKENIQPLKEWLYGGGLRIKKISHFTSSLSDAIPVKEINYEYQMFDNNNRSSGELYDGGLRNFSSGLAANPQVSYRNVKIYNTQNNGYIKHIYDSYTDSPFYINATFGYYQNYSGYKKGLLKKAEFYNSSNVLLKTVENQYDFEERGDLMTLSSMLNNGSTFSTKSVWTKLSATTTKEYFYLPENTKIISTNQTFSYNPNNLKISESTATNSNGEILKTNYFYHTGNSIYSQNRIGEIESVESYRGAELLSKSKVNYGNVWQGNVSLLPQTIVTAKGANALENRVEYKQYDEFSNPLEVQQEGGIPISYIWGYNQTQPIAKIENASYSQVQGYVTNLQTLSNGTDEGLLISALNNLRIALPNAMVTTYTYKPLVGISTITDPKGDKITYHYDGFNRLQFVKDKNGNILSENEYHYKD